MTLRTAPMSKDATLNGARDTNCDNKKVCKKDGKREQTNNDYKKRQKVI